MKFSIFIHTALLVVLFLCHHSAEAKLLQILHTNDTHSFLDNATHSKTVGGSVRLKGLIDQYKNKMNEKGVQTLVLDAGDFLEGNTYYMASEGKKSFQVHNEIGYDVGTLGNHDYQMGAIELDRILGEIDLKFSITVANLKLGENYKMIKEKIKPYQEFDFDGMKVAVLGLTTDEAFYKWRLTKGAILDPIETAKKYEEILKKRKNDYIIALTHLGVLKDIKLAEKTKSIDLIVGGHSHTALFKPTFVKNKNKVRVPIVQAGKHTEYLGRLMVDIEKGKPLKVVSYELLPVVIDDSAADVNLKQLVEMADLDLENLYGKEWLSEKIGYSDLKADDKMGIRKWAYFITDVMKESANADIAIHSPEMNGENFPVGDITRRVILNSIPRIFDTKEKFGWDIYTTKVKGVWLRATLNALALAGQPMVFSGIKIDYEKNAIGIDIKKVTIDGKKIHPLKTYTIAFTEGIVKGALGISSKTVAILRNPESTKIKIWTSLEDKIRNSPKVSIDRIIEGTHTLIWPAKE